MGVRLDIRAGQAAEHLAHLTVAHEAGKQPAAVVSVCLSLILDRRAWGQAHGAERNDCWSTCGRWTGSLSM